MINLNNNDAKIAEFLLQINAVKLQPSEPFKWASGWNSPIYCDNRKILAYPEIRSFIKNEFVDFLAGKENYYSKAVENLQFSLHSNQNIIYTCSKFLKEIYLVGSITIENKNRYAFDVIASSFNQIPLKLIHFFL